MSDVPLTWLIVERIADLLRQATVDGGYRTDIGLHVDTEPVQLDDTMALGAVVYSGRILPGEKSTLARPERVLEVIVDAYIGVDLANAQELQHAVYDDVERIFSGLCLSVPGALPLIIGPAQYLPRTDDMATAGVQILITTTYRPNTARADR